MAVVSLWIPAFRLAVARLREEVPPDRPVIVADRLERGVVVDASLPAQTLGVRPGMTLLQAQAVAPEARTVVDDVARDAAVWRDVLEALDAASPLVEDAGWGRAYLEMHGIDGGPNVWLEAVRGALAGLALPLRLGLGPNPFVARAAATVGEGTICRGDPAAFVAPLSLELLDCDDDVRARLRLLGVATLGALAALPHGPFVRRFGPAAAAWHEQARGIDRRPLRPRPRELRIERTRFGEGAADSEAAVAFALRALIGEVVDDLRAAGKRAGRLVLGLECDNGEVRTLTTRVAQPTAMPGTLFDVLRARLEGVRLDAPVVGLRLGAEALEDGGAPLGLFAQTDPDPEAVGIVLARLDAALGEGHALRRRLTDGPRIERRSTVEPFGLADFGAAARVPAGPAERATVQFRLVEPRPLVVHVGAGRPQFVGTPPQAVIEVAGPWRVDEQWWGVTGGGTPLVRDEYDILLEDGALIRISREGDIWQLRGIYD